MARLHEGAMKCLAFLLEMAALTSSRSRSRSSSNSSNSNTNISIISSSGSIQDKHINTKITAPVTRPQQRALHSRQRGGGGGGPCYFGVGDMPGFVVKVAVEGVIPKGIGGSWSEPFCRRGEEGVAAPMQVQYSYDIDCVQKKKNETERNGTFSAGTGWMDLPAG